MKGGPERRNIRRGGEPMKRLACVFVALLMMLSAARGEEWIVDDSLADDEAGFSLEHAEGEEYILNPYVLDLSFVGDCSIGGLPASRGMAGTYTAVVDEKGYDWPFSLVREYLEEDDATFANNEVVFSNSDKHQDKHTVLGAPPEYARVYRYSGIDIVNTANNHCLDYGTQGYRDTLAALDEIGMPHFGTLYPGTSRAQDQLGIIERKGFRIGAVGFSYPQDSDLPYIQERIRLLREQGCSLVIVSLHWGREVTDTPKGWQFTMARKIIAMGADVIWGHHPHILQQAVLCDGKPVMFSTGNFTFGAMKDVDPDTGIFKLRFDMQSGTPKLVRFAVIPCRTQGKGDYRPYPLTEEAEKKRMLKKLIYPRKVEDFENLPASFADTGVYVPGAQ